MSFICSGVKALLKAGMVAEGFIERGSLVKLARKASVRRFPSLERSGPILPPFPFIVWQAKQCCSTSIGASGLWGTGAPRVSRYAARADSSSLVKASLGCRVCITTEEGSWR